MAKRSTERLKLDSTTVTFDGSQAVRKGAGRICGALLLLFPWLFAASQAWGVPAALWAIPGIAMLAAIGVFADTERGPVPHLGFFAALHSHQVWTHAKVSVSAGGDLLLVSSDGIRRRLDSESIAYGYLDEGRAVIHLDSDRTVGITPGRRLLDALGLSAGQRVAKFPVGAKYPRLAPLTLIAYAGVCALTVAALSENWSYLIALGMLWPLFVVLLRWVVRRQVAVGSDGIHLDGNVITHDELVDIENVERGVRLTMRHGYNQLLPRSIGSRPMIHRVREERWKAHGLGEMEDRLSRGELEADEWVVRLKEVGKGGGDYRTSPVAARKLERIVVDAIALPEQRVGAAIALSAVDAEAARDQVESAVEACVDGDLKAALEAAAEGELDERALRRVSKRFY